MPRVTTCLQERGQNSRREEGEDHNRNHDASDEGKPVVPGLGWLPRNVASLLGEIWVEVALGRLGPAIILGRIVVPGAPLSHEPRLAPVGARRERG